MLGTTLDRPRMPGSSQNLTELYFQPGRIGSNSKQSLIDPHRSRTSDWKVPMEALEVEFT